jgi:hypothetical protein
MLDPTNMFATKELKAIKGIHNLEPALTKPMAVKK